MPERRSGLLGLRLQQQLGERVARAQLQVGEVALAQAPQARAGAGSARRAARRQQQRGLGRAQHAQRRGAQHVGRRSARGAAALRPARRRCALMVLVALNISLLQSYLYDLRRPKYHYHSVSQYVFE